MGARTTTASLFLCFSVLPLPFGIMSLQQRILSTAEIATSRSSFDYGDDGVCFQPEIDMYTPRPEANCTFLLNHTNHRLGLEKTHPSNLSSAGV